MKKIVCSFIVMSVFGIVPSFAASTSVPTKNYVDVGLQKVYERAKRLNSSTQDNIDVLTLYVGNPSDAESGMLATGLTKQVEDLSQGLTNVETKTLYTGNNRGVLVTDDRTIGIYGLTPSTGTNNKVYVFNNNVATELEIADTWFIAPVEVEGE